MPSRGYGKHTHTSLVMSLSLGTQLVSQRALMRILIRWCGLCGCWSSDQHVQGRAHTLRATTHGMDSFLAGTPKVPRGATTGCKAPEAEITFEVLAEYWGPNLLNMAAHAKLLIDARKSVRLKTSDGTGRLIPCAVVEGTKLVFVNYVTGQGKYSGRSIVIFEHQFPFKLPPQLRDSEWWPIIIMSLHEDYLKMQTCDTFEDEFWVDPQFMHDETFISLSGGQAKHTLAFASCIRQLGGPEIVAWPVRLHPILHLRGDGPPPPPPPLGPPGGVWEEPPPAPLAGDAGRPGAMAMQAEEVD